MGEILAITPNPAIDRTALVSGYKLGEIHRPQQLLTLPGGKGLNVARVLKRLGGPVRACAILAGFSGQWIARELEQLNLPLHATWVRGETRTCYSVLDTRDHNLTEVYEESAPITVQDWTAFEQLVAESISTANLVTFSGSLPHGAPQDGYARLIAVARAHGVPAVLDTHGSPLQTALAAQPEMIKVNAAEASQVLGFQLGSLDQAILAATQFKALGVNRVVITLGRDGALGMDANEAWLATPPPVDVFSTVGSGDALLAGFVLRLDERQPFEDALRFGVAVSAANTLQPGAGLFDPEDALAFLTRSASNAYKPDF